MVLDKIRDGEYTNRFPLVVKPARPEKPEGFDAESTRQYAEAYNAFMQVFEAWRYADVAYRQDADRIECLFRRDAMNEVFGDLMPTWPALTHSLYDYVALHEQDFTHRLARLYECRGIVESASIDVSANVCVTS